MKIKILGGGCPRCEKLEQTARKAAQTLGIDAEIIKVKKMDEIMRYDILETPALVIDEKVKSFGRIPAKEEVMEWMRDELWVC
jgi:small redox-active disulfide protein 2